MADKGGSFEREICRAISIWWTKGERDDVVWRNRLRRTQKAFNAQMQEGDLSATDAVAIPLFEILCIECKSGYSKSAKKPAKKGAVRNTPHDLLDIIDGTGKTDNSTILKFWEQTKEEANLTGRYPVLIFKRDFHRPVIVIDDDLRVNMINCADNFSLHSMSHIMLKYRHDLLFFYNLDPFLSLVEPDDIIKVGRKG